MNSAYHNLLLDTLQYLKDTYNPKTSWAAPKNLVVSIKKEIKEIKTPAPAESAKKPVQTNFSKEIVPLVPKNKEPISFPTPQMTPKLKTEEHLLPFEELKKNLHKTFPLFVVKDTPLSDTTPYLKALEAEVLLLCFQEGSSSNLFLKNLEKAIATYHKSAETLEPNTKRFPEDLKSFFDQTQNKLTIASKALLKNKDLHPFIKENKDTSEWFLGKNRLLLLEPFEIYFTNPLEKKTLWKTICAILSTKDMQASS